MKIDVIIPTMKKASLTIVYEHLQRIENVGSIIIVDFESNTTSYADNDGKVVHVNVTDQKYFNKSLAINIGFSYTKADTIVICDADILLRADFFSEALKRLSINENIAFTPEFVKETKTSEKRKAPGICALHRNVFLQVEGYCSEYEGWGLEDRDFLSRLHLINIDVEELSCGEHISHDDDERTRNYYSTSVGEMRAKNAILFERRLADYNTKGTLYHDLNSFLHLAKILNYENTEI